MTPFRFAILLLLAAAPVAHAGVPFRTVLVSGSTVTPSFGAKTLLVNTPEEFADAWSQTGSRRTPPEVDLRNHSVIFYFAGMRPTGGYSFTVEGVGHRGNALELDLLETTPGHLCGTSQIAIFPLIIVETTPWKHEVEVQLRAIPRDCAP